ncbi:SH2 domain-containing adapter protein D [Crotalus adamanteus]|uniref:SH2 domain-containing adapter protein D n=1 Tax=Crotalus adamanteus TaxID=8729 RepID=A0AAW1C3P8_CROAD
MAKWFKDYLSFGSRRSPPQPPKPDYTESDILKAYRAQKSLDFEDPYEDGEGKADPDPGGSPNKGGGCSSNLEGKYGSPKHRLIKVDASDLNRSKALLATAGEEAAVPSDQVKCGSETPLAGVLGWVRAGVVVGWPLPRPMGKIPGPELE